MKFWESKRFRRVCGNMLYCEKNSHWQVGISAYDEMPKGYRCKECMTKKLNDKNN